MFRLFYCLSFCLLSLASEINTSIFHIDHTTTGNEDISFCIRNIIEDIVEHNEYIVDVILLNVETVVEINKLHGIKRARYISKSFSWTESTLYNRIYVINVVDFNEFKSGMEQTVFDVSFNPTANFIIVIDIIFEDFKEKMEEFLVFNNIYNVSILVRDVDRYEIYTFHSPIHPCNHREMLILISHCSNYRGGSYIFPIIEDIRGCQFKLMSYNFFPLIIFDDKDEVGTEQRLISLFEEDAGIKIELLPYSKIDKLGRLVGNFTYTDIGEKVLKNVAEGAVGGYFVSTEGKLLFSFGYPLTVDHVVVIVRRSDVLDTWHTIVMKSYSSVLLVFFLFIIFSISAYLLTLFPSPRADLARDIFIVLGYFLNKVTLKKFKTGIPESLMVCSLLFSIFIIPYTMQAFMCSIKTHPIRGYEVKDFDEAKEKYDFVMHTEWMKSGLEKSREDCVSRLDCLKIVRDFKNKYTFISLELYEAYKWMLADEQCNLHLYRLNEPVATVMRTIYFRRGSVLVKPFDKYLFKVMSAGLITRYYNNIVYRERLKCKYQSLPASVPLAVRDFKIATALFLGGFCVSAVCFAYEVLARKG